MSRTSREIKELTFGYMLEISAGGCSITDHDIEQEEDIELREIMAGFLFLHEELELRRRSSEEAESAMREAKEMAEASNQAKTRFLANVSHELRTPMNGVLGMTELILQTGLGGEQLRYAEAIQSSARSLLVVIDDVLDMAKIESGRITIHHEAFDLESMITALIERYAPLVSNKESQLHLRCGTGVPRFLVSDAGRLGQILTNYIGNAIKFTTGGSVTLEIERKELQDGTAQLYFAVVDTGRGIPSDKLGVLFKPFSQVDTSMKREFSGTGLGLAISKQLASLLGGDVGVSSEVGSGSTFWLRLPLLVDEARASEQIPEQRRSWLPRRSSEPVAARVDEHVDAHVEPGPAVEGELWVLVVEDNVVNRVVATRMLQALGCRVETAVDGLEGLERAQARPYDIIFMDCQMPRMDGFEATAAIRERVEHGPHVPIVAMTAHAMVGDRERCLAAGMNDYITKPVSQDVLARVLGRQTSAGVPGGPSDDGARGR